MRAPSSPRLQAYLASKPLTEKPFGGRLLSFAELAIGRFVVSRLVRRLACCGTASQLLAHLALPIFSLWWRCPPRPTPISNIFCASATRLILPATTAKSQNASVSATIRSFDSNRAVSRRQIFSLRPQANALHLRYRAPCPRRSPRQSRPTRVCLHERPTPTVVSRLCSRAPTLLHTRPLPAPTRPSPRSATSPASPPSRLLPSSPSPDTNTHPQSIRHCKA
jgi:hypothetical protein